MTYYVYHNDSNFIGVTPFAWVALPGVSVIEFPGDVPDLNKCMWDFENLELIRNNPILTKLDFMSRFTTAERIAIQSSADPILKDAVTLIQMAEYVDVTDQRTMMLVGYLAMTSVILNERVAEVLA